jgi:hypothetical protein
VKLHQALGQAIDVRGLQPAGAGQRIQQRVLVEAAHADCHLNGR